MFIHGPLNLFVPKHTDGLKRHRDVNSKVTATRRKLPQRGAKQLQKYRKLPYGVNKTTSRCKTATETKTTIKQPQGNKNDYKQMQNNHKKTLNDHMETQNNYKEIEITTKRPKRTTRHTNNLKRTTERQKLPHKDTKQQCPLACFGAFKLKIIRRSQKDLKIKTERCDVTTSKQKMTTE